MLRFEPVFLLREAFMLWQDKAVRVMHDENDAVKNRIQTKIEEIQTDISQFA